MRYTPLHYKFSFFSFSSKRYFRLSDHYSSLSARISFVYLLAPAIRFFFYLLLVVLGVATSFALHELTLTSATMVLFYFLIFLKLFTQKIYPFSLFLLQDFTLNWVQYITLTLGFTCLHYLFWKLFMSFMLLLNYFLQHFILIYFSKRFESL